MAAKTLQQLGEGAAARLEEVGYAGRFLYESGAGRPYQDIADNYRKLLG